MRYCDFELPFSCKYDVESGLYEAEVRDDCGVSPRFMLMKGRAMRSRKGTTRKRDFMALGIKILWRFWRGIGYDGEGKAESFPLGLVLKWILIE